MILNAGRGRIDGDHYLPVTVETSRWGWWPNRQSASVMSVNDGAVLTVDTLSHEGILEDQGRDPVAFFAARAVEPSGVLADAVEIARDAAHSFEVDGPHVVTGPIDVRGAEPGDLLRVDVLGFALRVPYGVTSNRHGLGALPGEMPDGSAPPDTLTPGTPQGTVSVFTEVEGDADRGTAVLRYGEDRAVRYPIAPFLGMMGVTPDTSDPVRSPPPGRFGGNLDVKHLVKGATALARNRKAPSDLGKRRGGLGASDVFCRSIGRLFWCLLLPEVRAARSADRVAELILPYRCSWLSHRSPCIHRTRGQRVTVTLWNGRTLVLER